MTTTKCFNADTPDWKPLERAVSLFAGMPRSACAAFMWMGEWTEGEHSYKHRNTRNYARLRIDSTESECRAELEKALTWDSGKQSDGSQATHVAEYAIKVRKRGTKAWWFLSGNGGMNRLRIHAVRFSDQLKAGVNLALIEAGNPEYEAKVVPL